MQTTPLLAALAIALASGASAATSENTTSGTSNRQVPWGLSGVETGSGPPCDEVLANPTKFRVDDLAECRIREMSAPQL